MSNEANRTSEDAPTGGRGGVTRYVVAGAILLAVAAVGLGVLPRLSQDKALKIEAQRASQQAPRVEVVTAHYAGDSDLNLPGNIQALADTPVFARASGYIVKLYVDIGSRVQKGQLLAEIESPEVRLQLEQAKADTTRAQATVVQSQSDVEKLLASLAQAQADVARSAAGTQQARALLANAQSRLAQAKANKAAVEAKLAQAQQGLEGQKAAVQQSEAQLELAETTAKRYRNLLQQGFISQQEDDQAQATLKTARANNAAAQSAVKAAAANVRSAAEDINAAQAAVEAAGSDVRSSQESVNASQASERAARATVAAAQAGVRSGQWVVQANRAGVNSQRANQARYAALSSFQQLHAPFSGVITARNVDVGTLVAAGGGTGNTGPTATIGRTGLFGLARTEELRIQVSVPQTDFRTIGPGTRTRITVQELPGQVFEGTVRMQAGALDAASRTRLTEIRLKNLNGALLPGMFAQVAFATGGQARTLRVPANTLAVDAGGTRVVVVRPDHTLHFLPVQLGRDFGIEVEVLQGLKGDEALISNPNNALHEGMRVDVVPQSNARG